jgi:SEC-C motif-containing protein
MKNESDLQMPCPCGSGNAYAGCCQPFHQGKRPDNALKLMRSRYSAYALCLPAYIILTTHPANPQFCRDMTQWSKKISEFCSSAEFKKLEILDFQEKVPFATVTFIAHLSQGEKDTSFIERSYFEKSKSIWLYRNGQLKGRLLS